MLTIASAAVYADVTRDISAVDAGVGDAGDAGAGAGDASDTGNGDTLML